MMTPNCRGYDTDIFYEQAKWSECREICKGCPIIVQCRIDFLEDEFAFAGGMTPTQRKRWHQDRPGRKPKPRAPGSNRRISDEAKIEVVRLFDEENLSQQHISQRTGISKSAVRRILHDNGRVRTPEEAQQLALANSARHNAPARTDGDETIRIVLKYLEEGYKVKEVAALTGISFSHVYKIRREARS